MYGTPEAFMASLHYNEGILPTYFPSSVCSANTSKVSQASKNEERENGLERDVFWKMFMNIKGTVS